MVALERANRFLIRGARVRPGRHRARGFFFHPMSRPPDSDFPSGVKSKRPPVRSEPSRDWERQFKPESFAGHPTTAFHHFFSDFRHWRQANVVV